ncbi:DUF5691 domain-containing protein [Granulosicoccus antarcticus]|uniref:Uncharacterized protein n=1 Tax=Granulosicoccus antarcticus IMCC3135 TaxID=1192854 RepID=A0A2Z2NY14_9GAMM|nr:DUF5691 domain-containing protein [Granulosicoccus antarcticus]ASJ76179.1 hypothetical protein IMCC3135_30650 [Granulosicoccus antarcticus IMCC3135]
MSQSVLLKAALLGTQRCDDFSIAPHAQLEATWKALAEQPDRSAALLQAAALEDMALRAGRRATSVELPSACQAETQPYIPVAAARAAWDLMRGPFSQLLIEWINVARAGGYIVTPRLLPAMLEFGRANVNMRLAVADIVGSRGRWLAAQSETWAWLDSHADMQVDGAWWQTGTPSQRRAWLEQQLKLDPQQAAESIGQSWPGDSPDMRESFAELVADYPHAAHEDWLQQRALKDRRQATRRFATKALMQIPGSDFRVRAEQRALSLLTVKSKLLGRTQLLFNPPDHFDSQWLEDGIREKPPTGTGAKAFWATQMIAAIPLQAWSSLLEHDDPFSLTIDPDWADTIVAGWQQAASLYPHAGTLALLLKRLAKHDTVNSLYQALEPLLSPLEPNEVADLLEPLKLSDEQRLMLLRQFLPSLNANRHLVLHRVASEWPGTAASRNVSKADAIALAGCCDRQQIATLLERISTFTDLSASGEEFARALEYRHNYLKHFVEPNESR